MIIAIDIGNTNITFGVFDSKDADLEALGPDLVQPIHYANIQTDKEMTTDELAIKYMNLRTLWGLDKINSRNDIYISSVVPQINYEFYHMFEKYFSLTPHFVNINDIPLTVHYDFPHEIGADRLVDALAGMVLFPETNLIIVDFGTATTFDVVTKNRVYEGGLIMTGIMSSLRAS